MYRKKSVWKFAFYPCYALGVKRGRGKTSPPCALHGRALALMREDA
nr:MAG TPA: hypothetical protein [Caudoviricetes sp.]